MIKFDRDEFLRPQIYSTKEEYQTRCHVTNEIIKDIKDLQKRIDKAIKYIHKNTSYISIECMEQGLLKRDLDKVIEILGEKE